MATNSIKNKLEAIAITVYVIAALVIVFLAIA